MIKFNLQIVGYTVEVSAVQPSTKDVCDKFLGAGQPTFSVNVTSKDIDFERSKVAQEDALEGKPVRALRDEQLEITALQRKIAEKMFDYGTLVFHGSVVAVDGVAYLFTAKSGTGKSTHTALWRQVFGSRAVMVNDDKPFLHVGPEGVTAYGSPWNGKHGLGDNISAPLKAICILERGEENVIREIPASEALFMLLQQSNRPLDKTKMPVYMELLDGLSRKVRFYRMNCNMDPEAARMSYEAMSGNVKNDTEREAQYED